MCLRHVNPHTFDVHEECIGLYATERTNADCLTKLIKDVLIRSSLLLNRCRGQCYDSAANMSGEELELPRTYSKGAKSNISTLYGALT